MFAIYTSCDQKYCSLFEDAYQPPRLRNWEVPNWYPERPSKLEGRTGIISNDRGHLLPGVARPKTSPWGRFIGTWHYPLKITREVANKLSAPDQNKIKHWQRHCKRADHLTKQKQRKTKELHSDAKDNEEVKEAAIDKDSEMPEKERKRNAVVPYIPGDYTDDKYRHPSYETLVYNRFQQEQLRENAAPFYGYPRTREDFIRRTPDQLEDAEEFYRRHKKMLTEVYREPKNHYCERDAEKLSSPIVAAIKNFDFAKKLHKENLEHHPLPDTITDALYRKLQMQRAPQPGLALKEGNYAAGVAMKAYTGYGPTRCTKLKVFRPKTSITHKIKDSANDRPNSVNSFDKKWRFIRQSKVTPIQLAVCWDLTPTNPKDEPKRTTHIDGSNGSQAPAVFSLVNTSQDALERSEVKEQEFDDLRDCGNTLPFMYDPFSYRPKTSNGLPMRQQEKQKRIRSAYHKNLEPPCNDPRIHSPNVHFFQSKIAHDSSVHGFQRFCSKDCYKLKRHTNSRLCVACEMKNVNLKDTRPKEEFKMAFKAGVPQKNYKRQDYPEHRRLATVYQHSYKPVQARKRPLLETVFK